MATNMASRSPIASSSKKRSIVSNMAGVMPQANRPPPRTESIESQRRRNEAAEILQSYEKLSWYSYQRCETLTQTRLHFRCILAGLTPEQEEANVYWKEDVTPHAVKPRQQWSSNRRGKARVSSGIGAEAQESNGEEQRRKSGTNVTRDDGEASTSRSRAATGVAAQRPVGHDEIDERQ